MKKVLLLLILMFPLIVFAEDKDIFYLEEYNFSLKIHSRDTYKIEENFKTSLEYGALPDTYFFKRNIGDIYTFNYNNKKQEYKIKINLLDYSDRYFAFDDEVGLKTSFGHDGILLNSEENLMLKYDINFDNKNDEIFSYYIGNIEYDIKKTNFEIVLPYLIDDSKEILFSLDGKNFKKELDNLNYSIIYDQVIKGEYNKTLSKNSSIYFLVYDKMDIEKTINSTNMFIYIVPSVIFVIVICGVYLIYIRKKSK